MSPLCRRCLLWRHEQQWVCGEAGNKETRDVIHQCLGYQSHNLRWTLVIIRIYTKYITTYFRLLAIYTFYSLSIKCIACTLWSQSLCEVSVRVVESSRDKPQDRLQNNVDKSAQVACRNRYARLCEIGTWEDLLINCLPWKLPPQ